VIVEQTILKCFLPIISFGIFFAFAFAQVATYCAFAQQSDRCFAAEHQKIVSLLEQAKQKGVGIKPYQDALDSIDHDQGAGVSEEQLNKRLDSLINSINSQLRDISALHLGATSTYASPQQVKDWGNFAPFMLAAQSKIENHWNPPRTEQQSHRMVVTFKVARNGSVSSAKIARSSGVDQLDSSILTAVAASSPLPALPSSSKENMVDVEFTFDYNAHHGSRKLIQDFDRGSSSSAQTSENLNRTSLKSNNAFDINTFVYTVSGGVGIHPSPEYVDSVKRALATIPERLLNALQNRGCRVCVVRKFSDKEPTWQNARPRGYDEGLTGNNVPALFDGTDVVVCEYSVSARDNETLVRNRDVDQAVHHELGHAIDRYWGGLSHKEEFKHVYLLELARMDDRLREGGLAYYSQKAEGGPSECFAELCAIIFSNEKLEGTDSELARCFPGSIKIIRQILGV
jgi:TonB family protein